MRIEIPSQHWSQSAQISCHLAKPIRLSIQACMSWSSDDEHEHMDSALDPFLKLYAGPAPVFWCLTELPTEICLATDMLQISIWHECLPKVSTEIAILFFHTACDIKIQANAAFSACQHLDSADDFIVEQRRMKTSLEIIEEWGISVPPKSLSAWQTTNVVVAYWDTKIDTQVLMQEMLWCKHFDTKRCLVKLLCFADMAMNGTC